MLDKIINKCFSVEKVSYGGANSLDSWSDTYSKINKNLLKCILDNFNIKYDTKNTKSILLPKIYDYLSDKPVS